MQLDFNSSDWRTSPRRDHVEITVFGPGYGESVLVHVGQGNWVVIDSCIDSSTKEPVALQYLRAIGYHPPECVKLVVATHWHDDHVAGLSEVVRVCENAEFCCSSAMGRDEFQTLLEVLNERPLTAAGSRVRELYQAQKVLLDRGRVAIGAVPNRPVYKLGPANSGHGEEVTVHTLSPSDKQVSLFYKEIGALTQAARTYRQAPTVSPNHLSVAALVEIGPFGFLAGADLEEVGDPQLGWSAVIASPQRPATKAKIYKVAHHGSVTAHHAGIWSDLLSPAVSAVLTPWNRSSKLPQPEDVNRIKGLSEALYVTADAAATKSGKTYSHSVRRQLGNMNVKISRAEPRVGAVRFRGAPQDSFDKFTVELAGTSFKA